MTDDKAKRLAMFAHASELLRADPEDETLRADLWYPRSESEPGRVVAKFVEVGLVDVRAADPIRISYDFDRDGWKIEQAQRFSWPDGVDRDPMWKEVAFVKAWGSEDEAWEREVRGGDE